MKKNDMMVMVGLFTFLIGVGLIVTGVFNHKNPFWIHTLSDPDGTETMIIPIGHTDADNDGIEEHYLWIDLDGWEGWLKLSADNRTLFWQDIWYSIGNLEEIVDDIQDGTTDDWFDVEEYIDNHIPDEVYLPDGTDSGGYDPIGSSSLMWYISGGAVLFISILMIFVSAPQKR